MYYNEHKYALENKLNPWKSILTIFMYLQIFYMFIFNNISFILVRHQHALKFFSLRLTISNESLNMLINYKLMILLNAFEVLIPSSMYNNCQLKNE